MPPPSATVRAAEGLRSLPPSGCTGVGGGAFLLATGASPSFRRGSFALSGPARLARGERERALAAVCKPSRAFASAMRSAPYPAPPRPAPLPPRWHAFPHTLRRAGRTRRYLAAPPPERRPVSASRRRLPSLPRHPPAFCVNFFSFLPPSSLPTLQCGPKKERKKGEEGSNKHPAGHSFNSLAPRTRQPPRAPMAALTRDWREEGGRWRVGRCRREGGCRGRGWGDPGACRFLKGAQRPAQPEKPGCTRAVCLARERGAYRALFCMSARGAGGALERQLPWAGGRGESKGRVQRRRRRYLQPPRPPL